MPQKKKKRYLSAKKKNKGFLKLIYKRRYYRNVAWGWGECRKVEKENNRKMNRTQGAHNFHLQICQ